MEIPLEPPALISLRIDESATGDTVVLSPGREVAIESRPIETIAAEPARSSTRPRSVGVRDSPLALRTDTEPNVSPPTYDGHGELAVAGAISL